MSIAQAVFLQVQALPEDKAQEVLDFARFLSQYSKSNVTENVGKRQAGLLKDQVKIFDEDWHKPSVEIEDDFYQ